ncbi:FAD-binding oxidoreductase [Chloroflexota bacterium]
MNDSVKRELERIIGSARVTDNEGALWAYAFNDFGSFFNPPFVGGRPDIVVKPTSTEEVSKILELATETATPVVPAGGREGNAGGAVPTTGGILVDLTLMNKITSISKKSRAVRVQAGITYTQLRDKLRKEGYWLGNQGPSGPMGGTLGGGISLTSTGLGGGQYGQYGENVLGLQVVLPTGDVIETGSMSNPDCDWYHRYCCGIDTAGLFIGAAGSLGIITEAAVNIYRMPPYGKTHSYAFTDIEASCRTLDEQDSYEWLYSHSVLIGEHSISKVLPPENHTAQLIPRDIESLLTISMRGHDEIILQRQGEIMDEIAERQGGILVELPMRGADPMMVARLAGMGLTCFCEIIYPILQAPKICRYILEEFIPKYQDMMVRLPGTSFPFWSLILSGVTNHAKTDLTFVYGVDVSNHETREETRRVYHELLSHIYSQYGGGAPHALAKDMYTPHWRKTLKPEYAEFLLKLKNALDPNGILNPGSLWIE